ncbi:septal ring lytic transglycosylase RlpA family protein [Methylobrevis pamukkalensis]|uniref:Endolytic peptidoglycan transglycosylase RlpA n=1 Tax=Methylobrevis pamukkalensis TaxID=1439726 RepID=A0A1E3H5M1_9HYPH|nr:septal ring lytic transglycosylase RlpA family protein [Methylobrevis pamukkalensis]ODN70821.1 RlpA-like protein precursor [Methylobrevis pamukkalensis]
MNDQDVARPAARQARSKLRRHLGLAATAIVTSICLAACATAPGKINSRTAAAAAKVDPKYGVKPSPRVVADGSSIPKGGGRAIVGKPYTVAGKRYVPKEDKDYAATGLASWYGDAFHGRFTANGEIYDMTHLSAAHTTMPLPSYARVTSVDTGRSVMVRVNDRGPFHGKRIMDLSKRAADLLGIRRAGVAKIKVAYVGPAPKDGDDTKFLVASYRGPADALPDSAPATMIARNEALLGVSREAAPAKRQAAPAVQVAAPAVQVAKIDVLPRVRPSEGFVTYAIVASADPADAFFAQGNTMLASLDVPAPTTTSTGFDPSLVQKASFAAPSTPELVNEAPPPARPPSTICCRPRRFRPRCRFRLKCRPWTPPPPRRRGSSSPCRVRRRRCAAPTPPTGSTRLMRPSPTCPRALPLATSARACRPTARRSRPFRRRP